jgi:predicted 3-demethylubiquinone-9 3-methyltransferase (glyoxalase superfamily)
MQKITPFLWFDTQAEEAANFYTSIFPNSRIVAVSRYGDAGPGAKGSVMTISFELDGQRYTGLNGGPTFKFTEAVSFVVACETQEELDRYWNTLMADGGKPVECGWLRDKYGLSWQIVPANLDELLSDEDTEASNRVMVEVMKMVKLDIATLQRAHDGK